VIDMEYPSESDARAALRGVEEARRRVLDQIGMPWWYWTGLALAWLGLGILADVGAPVWTTSIATIAVGAGHATLSQRVLGGRQRANDVRVAGDAVGRHSFLLVFGFLAVLVGVTVAVAVGLDADGAGHPAIWAAGFVAVLVLLGGPRVTTWMRQRAIAR
jgi:hypothetical protein